MLPNPQSYANWLALIRIYTGFSWLLHGVPKLLNPNFAGPNGMMAGILRESTATSSGPYHDFIVNVVLPNSTLFGHLVAWGETLTGVSLLLGLLTRLGGFFGVFLPLNYWLMKSSYAHLGEYASLEVLTIALSFINLVLPTGLVLGLDGRLNRWWRTRKLRGKT